MANKAEFWHIPIISAGAPDIADNHEDERTSMTIDQIYVKLPASTGAGLL